MMGEMQRRLAALKPGKDVYPVLKELAVKLGLVSVFRYSAGLVPWSATELGHITKMCVMAFKQAWSPPP